mgnify:CR=1 FL=1
MQVGNLVRYTDDAAHFEPSPFLPDLGIVIGIRETLSGDAVRVYWFGEGAVETSAGYLEIVSA